MKGTLLHFLTIAISVVNLFSSSIVLVTSAGLAFSVSLSPENKNLLTLTEAYNQDLLALGVFFGTDDNTIDSYGTVNSDTWTLKASTTYLDLPLELNYFGTFNPTTDTVSWNQTGVFGNEIWRSSGVAVFSEDGTITWEQKGVLDDFEEGLTIAIPLGGSGSGEPDFEVGFEVKIPLGGPGPGEPKFDFYGKYGDQNTKGMGKLTIEDGKVKSATAGVEVTKEDKKIQIETGVETNKEGSSVVVKGNVKKIPEPLTILGSGLALGFGAWLQRDYSKRRKKV